MNSRCLNKNTIYKLCVVVIVFLLSSLRISKMITIWNQNDEFGVWQGAAWILGLDWSSVSSEHGFYGQGYGVLLAPILKIWGTNVILMTRVAIGFQAMYHAFSALIAWYCASVLFPNAKNYQKAIAVVLALVSAPEIYYVYSFFSECILRFLVWIFVGLVVSYYHRKRLYKLLLLMFVSIYAFSVHQRCILLIAIFLLVLFKEIICESKNKDKSVLFWVPMMAVLFILLYLLVYKYPQAMYMDKMYVSHNEKADSNLLSGRGYSLAYFFRLLFNKDKLVTANYVLSGLLFYSGSFDFGLLFCGIFLCMNRIWGSIRKKGEMVEAFAVIALFYLSALMLNVIQIADYYDYERVDLLMYGRYISYVFSPLIMLGVLFCFECSIPEVKKITMTNMLVILITGKQIYSVFSEHNMTKLFAFHNSCVGLSDKYYSDGPLYATLYYTIVGVAGIITLGSLIYFVKKKHYQDKFVVLIFLFIACIWVKNAYQEIDFTNEMKASIVKSTHDLTGILGDEQAIVAFKSNSYGEGLLQYNIPFVKVYVCKQLEDMQDDYEGMLVVSYLYIDEKEEIYKKYEVVYENGRYFVWRYSSIPRE